MPNDHEYVFMSYETLRQLREDGEAESAVDVIRQPGPPPRFAHYKGKRVLTTRRGAGLISDGLILSEEEASEQVKEHIRENVWSRNWPLPDCLCSSGRKPPERALIPPAYPK